MNYKNIFCFIHYQFCLIVTSSLILSSSTIKASSTVGNIQLQMSASASAAPGTMPGDGKFHFAIDRGGTFTDVFCCLPDGRELVSKLLSEDPAHYPDAPTEGIRRILSDHDKDHKYPRHTRVLTSQIGSIRMGTTVATNALLERNGSRMALLITKGFQDLLEIGDQSRPDIFDLTCKKPSLLYEQVVEVNERTMLKQYSPPDFADNYPQATGITGEDVLILQPPNLADVKIELEALRDKGITSLAIAFLHSYTYPNHEQAVGELANSMGCFEQISMSSAVMAMVKLVPRGHTSCAAAYLTPKITTYLQGFIKGFDDDLLKNVPLTFMVGVDVDVDVDVGVNCLSIASIFLTSSFTIPHRNPMVVSAPLMILAAIKPF
jgi:5-oxoprolinase (ATP-hydrolysing)